MDLVALAEARAELLRPAARLVGVTLDVTGQGRAVVNADDIGRALENLMRNAVEASPRGARVEVAVEQCRGAWYDLEPEDRCYLHGHGLRNQLGEGAVAGDMVWDQQSRFRIRLGPLNLEEFRSFLPGGRALAQLSSLTRFFIGPTLAFEVQPVLKGADVPWPSLNQAGAPAPQLGWNSWLRTGEMDRDPDDAVFPVTG